MDYSQTFHIDTVEVQSEEPFQIFLDYKSDCSFTSSTDLLSTGLPTKHLTRPSCISRPAKCSLWVHHSRTSQYTRYVKHEYPVKNLQPAKLCHTPAPRASTISRVSSATNTSNAKNILQALPPWPLAATISRDNRIEKPVESENKHPMLTRQPPIRRLPASRWSPLLPASPVPVRLYQQTVHSRPSPCRDSNYKQFITGQNNSGTSRQWCPLSPPYHHTLPEKHKPVSTGPYQTQNLQLTHHTVCIPALVIIVTDWFMNRVADKSHAYVSPTSVKYQPESELR